MRPSTHPSGGLIGRIASDGAPGAGEAPISDFAASLSRALVESRQRYKDLVELSGEFAWETDEAGRFIFVSPAGALGYRPDELVGTMARDLCIEGNAGVFAARERLHDIELALRRADGGAAHVIVAVAPSRAEDGSWCGARGMWHDVTEERLRAQELAAARVRERLVTRVLRTMRDEVDPEKALLVALETTQLALAADGGMVVTASGAVAARAGAESDAEWIAAASSRGASGAFDGAIGDRAVIGDTARHRGTANGTIVFWRGGGASFAEDERMLLADLAGQFGAALAAVTVQAEILTLSRTDPLTGLLNRRAFFSAMETAMERAAGTAALLYADMDNLKRLNDTRGHEVGDEALLELCRILRDNTRKGDLIGRLGGDEFALWLDGVDAATTERRIEALVAAGARLGERFADDEIGLSIGSVLFNPEEALLPEELIARADSAMYEVKRARKAARRSAARGEAA